MNRITHNSQQKSNHPAHLYLLKKLTRLSIGMRSMNHPSTPVRAIAFSGSVMDAPEAALWG